MSDEALVRRWTTKRKSTVVIDITKGKITPVQVARQNNRPHQSLGYAAPSAHPALAS